MNCSGTTSGKEGHATTQARHGPAGGPGGVKREKCDGTRWRRSSSVTVMALGRFAVRSGQTAVWPSQSVIRRFEIGVKTLYYRGNNEQTEPPEPPMGTSQVCRAGLVLILASAGPLR